MPLRLCNISVGLSLCAQNHSYCYWQHLSQQMRFVSSVSSRFLEDLLNEASASADMQQTCRKASYGSVPGMSLTLILAASCKGIIREHSYAHSCTGCTAWRPFSWVVKPARKQGWTYSGKSTMLPSTFFFVLNWLTSAICQTQKKAALLQICVVLLEKLQ